VWEQKPPDNKQVLLHKINTMFYVHTQNGTFTHIKGKVLDAVKTEAVKFYDKFNISIIEKRPSVWNGKVTDHYKEVYRNY
jgi:hypothetical protein